MPPRRDAADNDIPQKLLHGSDASDAPSPLPIQSVTTKRGTPDAIDPIVAEHGPLFFVDGDKAEINQIAVAAKFAHEKNVSFDDSVDEFRVYDNDKGHFPATTTAAVKWLLGQFVKQLAEANGAQEFIRKRTNSLLGSLVTLLKGIPTPGSKEPTGRRLIHVANGMLDLSGAAPRLLPFSPAYRSTQRCDIAYDPTAKCPRFLEELLQPALSREDISLVNRYCGAILLARNKAQRLLIVHGAAAAGKSTVVNIIEQVIGGSAVAHLRTEHLGSRFETSFFRGKKLLAGKDVPADFLRRSGAKMLKALIGDDRVEAEVKFGSKHQIRGDLNIILTSNSTLNVSLEGDADAWRRRLLIVEFNPRTPAKRVANFADTLLREEGEGILAWMVEGALEHLAELNACGDYKLTEIQHHRIDALLEESDSVAGFVRANIIKKPGAELTVEELKGAYFEVCSKQKWTPASERQFEHEISKLVIASFGIPRRNDLRRGKGWARGFKGIALAAEIRELQAGQP